MNKSGRTRAIRNAEGVCKLQPRATPWVQGLVKSSERRSPIERNNLMASYISKFDRLNITGRLSLLLIAVVLGTAGCAKTRNDNGSGSNGGHTDSSAASSTPASVPPPAVAAGTPT